MEDILIDLVNNGKKILLLSILEQPRYMMERIDIIPDLVPTEHIFSNFKDCMVWVKENVKVEFSPSGKTNDV
jgi:SulP family sulfate permease